MIVFDENVEEYWIQLIKSKGYTYISIREQYQGVSDNQVIEIARNVKGLLVTEDKDFGELLFAHKVEKVAVLFMRYDQPQYIQIQDYFLRYIDEFLAKPEISFITISKNKVRKRSI